MALTMPNQWYGGGPDFVVPVTPTPGNWLVAVVTLTTADQSSPQVAISDDATNLWTLAYANTRSATGSNIAGQVYAQVWVCPSVQYSGWSTLDVYLAIMPYNAGDGLSSAINVFEIAGMGNGYLTVDSVTVGTASATAFSLVAPAPVGAADCLMIGVAGSATPSGVTITSTGWTLPVGLQVNSAPYLQHNSAWRESTTTQTLAWSCLASTPWAGAMVALRVTGTIPAVQGGFSTIPGWPIIQLQLGLGYNLATPLTAVAWTDLSPRFRGMQHTRGIPYELDVAQAAETTFDLLNKDGALTPRTPGNAPASATGTTTTIKVATTNATNINVSDFFQLQTAAGALKEVTVFQVTAISSAGGTTTITFARADSTGSGALAATATGNLYTGVPIDIYIPVRVLATYGGKTYPVYTGWMETWPQTWELRNYGIVPAIGVDAMGTLAANDQTIVRGEILRRNPTHYWPLDDPSSSLSGSNLSGVSSLPINQSVSKYGNGAAGVAAFGASTQAIATGQPAPIATTGILGDPGSGWQQSGLTVAEAATKGSALVAQGSDFPSIANGVTILVAAQWNFTTGVVLTSTYDPTIIIVRTTDPGQGLSQGNVIRLSINHGTPSGVYQFYPQVTVWDKSSHAATVNNVNTGPQIFQTSFGVVALTFNQTSFNVYCQSQLSITGSCNLASNFTVIDIGGEADGFNNGRFDNTVYAHAAVFPRMLTLDEIIDIQDAVFSGVLQSETTASMIGRKLDTVSWRGARALGAGGQLVATEDASTGNVVDKINSISGYEDGTVFIDAAGTLQFRTRYRAYYQTSTAVLGDGTGEIPYLDNITYDFDLQYLYNSIETENTTNNQTNFASAWFALSSSTYIAKNHASIKKYGTQSLSRATRLYENNQAFDLAQWLLSRFSTPELRVEQVTVDPTSNPSIWPFVFGIEIGDLVTLNRRPTYSPMVSSNCRVLQISHDVSPGHWLTTLSLGIAPPSVLITNDTQYGIVGTNSIGA